MKPSASAVQKRIAAAVGVAVVLAVVLVVGQLDREPIGGDGDAGFPTDAAGTVSRMLAAEKEGDVAAYLECFDGQLLDILKQQLADSSKRTAMLRGGAADLKAYTLTEPEADGDTSTLVLERIFADYNANQEVTLRRDGEEWHITALGTVQRNTPEIPYGTRVSSDAAGKAE